MKKTVLLCLAATLTLLSCQKDDMHRYFSTEMNIQRAELYADNVAVETGTTVPSKDLRIKLFCDFKYLNRGIYSDDDGNSPKFYKVNQGLDPDLNLISLTCNKEIANIEAGADLLSIMGADVYLGREKWSVEAWRNMLNYHNSYYSSAFDVITGMTYEFDLAFLPYYVTVAEDDYEFTLNMFFGWLYYSDSYEYIYSKTFPAVHLK